MNILLKMLSSALVLCCSGACHQTTAKPAQITSKRQEQVMQVSATLLPTVSGRQVNLRITITNFTARSLIVEPRHLFREKGALGSMLEMTSEGTAVPYTGMMSKRAATLPESTLVIPPRGSAFGDTDLTHSFAFLPGQHTYQIEYDAFIADQEPGQPLLEVKSAPVNFTYER